MAWFESWFNSPWYHILYAHRDEKDAEHFLDALLQHLHPPAGSSILDLGCGRGRHSVYLNKKGFRVTGLDLSPESILHCRKSENETLSFFVHDMRHLFRVNDFDYVLNLFTSFGYFDTDREHQTAIQNAALSLKPGGTLIIDYLNASMVSKSLVEAEEIIREGITFRIQRKCEQGIFIKQISFECEGTPYRFEEKVAALDFDDFKRYFASCGLTLSDAFGDYSLNPYNAESSPRLILKAVKTA